MPLLLGIRVAVADVPQAPVEMDHVPFPVTEPLIDVLETVIGSLAVAGNAEDIGLAF